LAIKNTEAGDSGSGIGQLQESILEDVLCHTSPDVRSSAVSILIASPSTSKPYTIGSLSLLQRNLPAFHSDADARFRYDVLGHSKNMIMRILGAINALRRDYQRILKKASKPGAANSDGITAEIQCLINHHEDFVNWYLEFLKHELVPTASYQRHIISLKTMEFILRFDLLKDGQDGNEQSGPNFCLVDATWLRAILDLLMDPFEDVRETTASVLMLLSSRVSAMGSETPQGFSKPLRDELEEFCSRSSALASKTSRADHSDGVARSFEILCHWTSSREDKLAIPARVLKDLEARLAAAERDLASAVIEAPVHGHFASLR
jgi:hypothetical protein